MNLPNCTVFRPATFRGGRGGGRPFYRGRRRSGLGAIAVDRRTKCVNASGFEREDKEEVLAHFAVK